MKKILAFLLAVILVVGLSACGSNNVNWEEFKIDGTTYKVGTDKDSAISIEKNSSTEYLLYFNKGGTRLGKAASILTGNLASVQQDMEKVGSYIEQRSDDNATYTIYKSTDTTAKTTYFFIVDFKDKDGFMSYETEGDIEGLREIYNAIYVK